MKMMPKISVIILMILVFIQLDAFPVPSYSYGNMKGNSFRMGLGFLSAVKPMDKLDKFSFYQPYVKFGLLNGYNIGLDFQYRADVMLFNMDHALSATNILTLHIGKSLPEIGAISNPSFNISYGYGLAAQQHLITAFAGDIGPVNSVIGMNIYNTNDLSIVNGIFTKITMSSNTDMLNVSPYIFLQIESWDMGGNTLFPIFYGTRSNQLILGGGFSIYLNLTGGEKQ